MTGRFGKGSLIAAATTGGERLYNRIVDAYYEDGAFYVSTYALSNKIKQIESKPEVAVCAVDWFSGHGNGRNLGWVPDPQNAEIRLKLRGMTAPIMSRTRTAVFLKFALQTVC